MKFENHCINYPELCPVWLHREISLHSTFATSPQTCSLSCVPRLRGQLHYPNVGHEPNLGVILPCSFGHQSWCFCLLYCLNFCFSLCQDLSFLPWLLPYSSLILILSPFVGYNKLFKLYLGILRKDHITSYYLLPPPLNILFPPVILTTQHPLSYFSIC